MPTLTQKKTFVEKVEHILQATIQFDIRRDVLLYPFDVFLVSTFQQSAELK